MWPCSEHANFDKYKFKGQQENPLRVSKKSPPF